MDDQDSRDSEERSAQVRNALLKGLGLLVAVCVVIALGTTLAVQALGLDEDESSGPVGSSSGEPVTPLPTSAIPVPGEKTEEPEEEPSEDPEATSTGRIQLAVSPVIARPNERINLTGTYRRADNVALAVQRFEDGAWADFGGVSATVRVGSFATYVMTSRSGEQRFRVYDPQSKQASNVVMVTVD